MRCTLRPSNCRTAGRLGVVILLLAACAGLPGCGPGDAGPAAPAAESPGQQAVIRQLEAERAELQRETRSLRVALDAQRQDTMAAVLIWTGTAAALFLVIVLFAGHRRSQRVLVRLLQFCAGYRTGPDDTPTPHTTTPRRHYEVASRSTARDHPAARRPAGGLRPDQAPEN